MSRCPYCDSPHLSQYRGLDGEFLCPECGRREILGVLSDLDAEETKKIRRRIEDRLRKSPRLMLDIAVQLILAGEIQLPDLE